MYHIYNLNLQVIMHLPIWTNCLRWCASRKLLGVRVREFRLLSNFLEIRNFIFFILYLHWGKPPPGSDAKVPRVTPEKLSPALQAYISYLDLAKAVLLKFSGEGGHQFYSGSAWETWGPGDQTQGAVLWDKVKSYSSLQSEVFEDVVLSKMSRKKKRPWQNTLIHRWGIKKQSQGALWAPLG